MLYRTHVISALEERREEFVTFGRALVEDVLASARRLRALGGRTAADVKRESGALSARISFPSDELDGAGGMVVRFDRRWRSHEEARRWALETLRGRVTFAADGSQVFPGREASVPVAAVQVASFENPHSAEGRYLKDVHFEVITPEQLLGGGRAYESPDQIVGARRFELEAQAVRKFLERWRGWRERGERVPVAFFDNTLVVSSRRKDTEILFSKRYTSALSELILLSREAQVPVVGYVDHSYAPDMRDLLEALDPDLPPTKVYDAQLLRAHGEGDPPLLESWGDRTVFWHCQRQNLAESFFDERAAPLVGFVYLQTTGEGHPARLDIPAWVYESGLLEEVLDAVRAECVVGNGYPYAIETADEAAVMTARDREHFLRVMQDFADQHRLDFRISRKAASKGRRR
ncbi:MAG: DNA double-strand break repair nuclease NurA [Acidobacteriota bacterium]|nr:DNA double-strand break repair nuclease NurA [Acidobacteriota bacterium]MDQ5835682.1 DNA double-strand break repair nuclease NurA [Acidobacteriota bacterium]